MKKIGNTNYTTFDDLWNNPEYLSEEDKSLIEFEVDLIGKLKPLGYTLGIVPE